MNLLPISNAAANFVMLPPIVMLLPVCEGADGLSCCRRFVKLVPFCNAGAVL